MEPWQLSVMEGIAKPSLLASQRDVPVDEGASDMILAVVLTLVADRKDGIAKPYLLAGQTDVPEDGGTPDIILADDSLCLSASTVEKGRTVHSGIKKLLAFILSVRIVVMLLILYSEPSDSLT